MTDHAIPSQPADAPSDPAVAPRRRRLLFKLAVLLLAGVVLVLALEVAARVLRLGGDPGGLVPNAVHDHSWPASFSAPALSQHGDWGGHDMVTNADGLLMTAELPTEATPCVVFVGDSFTGGRQVSEDKRYVTLMGERLGLPAYNFGCASFSPLLSRLQLERFEDRLAPRAVVLTLFSNDFADEHGYDKRAERDAAGRAVAVRGVPASALRTTLRRSALYRFVRLLYLSGKEPEWRRRTDAFPQWYSAPIEDKVPAEKRALVERSIEDIAAWCAARGAKLVLTTVPDQGSLVQEKPDHLSEYAAAVAERCDVLFADAAAGFRQGGGKHAYFLPRDAHFSEAGHAAMADALLPVLRGVLE